MGRHSAPGDDEVDGDLPVAEGATLELAPAPRGRHSSREGADTESAATGDLLVLEPPAEVRPGGPDALLEEPVNESVEQPVTQSVEQSTAPSRAEKKAARAAKKAARGETNSQADLRLLRTDSAVRAQCIGAVVVAFGLYTLVLAVIGKLSVYAVWVWIPILLSGVLVGVVLDLAHRRASAVINSRSDTAGDG